MDTCPECGRPRGVYLTASREAWWDALQELVSEIERKPTYEELGERLGVSAEAAWKRGKWFRDAGWVRWDRDVFELLQPETTDDE